MPLSVHAVTIVLGSVVHAAPAERDCAHSEAACINAQTLTAVARLCAVHMTLVRNTTPKTVDMKAME